MATKPYAAGGAYIARMSDYCQDCAYDVKQRTGPAACPFNYLYWDFFARHGDRFGANPRIGMAVKTWAKKPAEEQRAVRSSAQAFLDRHVPTD